MELPCPETEKATGETYLGEMRRSQVLDTVSLRCLLDISRDDEYAIGDRSLALRRSVFKFTNMDVINIHVVFKAVKPKELTKEGCQVRREL